MSAAHIAEIHRGSTDQLPTASHPITKSSSGSSCQLPPSSRKYTGSLCKLSNAWVSSDAAAIPACCLAPFDTRFGASLETHFASRNGPFIKLVFTSSEAIVLKPSHFLDIQHNLSIFGVANKEVSNLQITRNRQQNKCQTQAHQSGFF